MANYIPNIAKGRFNELMKRVDGNDPTNSAIILVPLSATDTEANRQDDDNLSVFLAAAPNELSGNGWVRKTLTDADLAAPAPDDVNNRYSAALPQVTWSAPTAGTAVALAICYDADTTSGDDTNIEVLGVCDFSVVSDSNDVILNAGDFARAS